MQGWKQPERQAVVEFCWVVRGWKGYSDLGQRRDQSGQCTVLPVRQGCPPLQSPTQRRFQRCWRYACREEEAEQLEPNYQVA